MAEPIEKKGLFAPAPPPPQPSVPTERLNELAARLRLGEERYSDLRKKVLFVEQNMLSNHRHAMSMIKSVQDELTAAKRDIQDVKDSLLKIVKELRLAARREDIDVLRRYVELWDPVKFCTVDQVERMINEKLVERPAEVAEEPEETEEPEIVEEVEETDEESEPEEESGESSLGSYNFDALLRKHDETE